MSKSSSDQWPDGREAEARRMTNGIGDDSTRQARNRARKARGRGHQAPGTAENYPAFRIGNLGRSFTDGEG